MPSKEKFLFSIDLLIIIASAVDNYKNRNILRKTSLRLIGNSTKQYVFLIGKSLNETKNKIIKNEYTKFNDIVQLNIIDDSYNLTLKSVLMLDWIRKYVQHARYIMKLDDDVFVNPFNLNRFVYELILNEKIVKNNKKYIIGYKAMNWKPIRNITHKYFISSDFYQHSYYPNFIVGSCYIIPQEFIENMFFTSLNTLYFPLEDVFLNGLVAYKNKIKLKHNSMFINNYVDWIDSKYNDKNLFKIALESITMHKINCTTQQRIWEKLFIKNINNMTINDHYEILLEKLQ